MSGLATTIAAIAKSKAAAAALGVVLVGGTGTAAAIAATHNGDIGPIHTPLFAHGNDNGDHAHTISIEGVLDSVKSCPSSVTTIVVTKASKSAEHDVKESDGAKDAPEATHAPAASHTPGAEATEVERAETPSAKPASGTETLTVTLNSKTRVNGQAETAADLCGKTGHKVQVQAEKNAAGALVAWKVTLQGADTDASKESTPSASGNGGAHSSVSGAVTSVGKASFTLKDATGKLVTISVNAQTVFSGRATGLSGLHAGEKVTVEGTKQADGSILATRVVVSGN